VYRFSLGTHKWGWFIVVALMIIHILKLFVFVNDSKRDINDSDVDVIHLEIHP
jgi:hypothetical protein